MSTRYGRKAADGTTEYYDSKAQLLAAEEQESNNRTRWWFALFGLVIGGVLTTSILNKYVADWPKLIRFALVILGGGLGAFTLFRSALLILGLIGICIALAVVVGIGAIIWHAI